MENLRPQTGAASLVAYFRSGAAIRSRSVGARVLHGMIEVPEIPLHVSADWDRETGQRMALQAGDVDPMPLARTQLRWKDYARCVRRMADWTAAQGLAGILDDADAALMACRGADYHHDGMQYGGAAFCNVFLSEDKGLDVHFPQAGLRIPLLRGTAMIFDTCQPHAVITRGSSGYGEADFEPERDNAQVFLSWELPIENTHVVRALGVTLDVDASNAAMLDEDQVWCGGAPAVWRPDLGRWERNDGQEDCRQT